jgi:hypothetical protein
MEVLSAELFELVKFAITAMLPRVKEKLAKKAYIPRRTDFPTLSYRDNGFPIFGKEYEGPYNYGGIFDPSLFGSVYESLAGGKAPPELEEFPEVINVEAFLDKRFYENYYGTVPDPDYRKRFAGYDCRSTLKAILDAYIHAYTAEGEIIDERLLPIYRPFENRYLNSTVPLNIWIPILFLNVPVDLYAISDDIEIRKIPDDIQLARATPKSNGLAVHDLVMSGATHALVLTNYQIQNDTWNDASTALQSVTAYPTELIEAFFASLRIASGLDTGYAQLLAEPIGTLIFPQTINLKQLLGTSTRKYPAAFENYYWNHDEMPTVTVEMLDSCKATFHQILALPKGKEKNRLQVALSRFNQCYLREVDDDSILDATIALEVLFSDGGKEEITHKLALRIAAVVAKFSTGISGQLVFSNIKKIYNFRSNVVHGNIGTIEKSRQIKLPDETVLPTVALALDYLRVVLGALLKNQKYLDPNLIDAELILEPMSVQTS